LVTDDEAEKQATEDAEQQKTSPAEPLKPAAAAPIPVVASKPTPPAQAAPAAGPAKPSDDQPKMSITIKQRKKEQPPIKPILEAEIKSSNDLLKTDDSLTAPAAIKEIIDEILLDRPPTPPKPKVFLPPIDVVPFIKYKIQQK